MKERGAAGSFETNLLRFMTDFSEKVHTLSRNMLVAQERVEE